MLNKFSTNKSRKNNKKILRKTFTRKDYMSGDGMLTTVWGPAAWHLLHKKSLIILQILHKRIREIIKNLSRILQVFFRVNTVE